MYRGGHSAALIPFCCARQTASGVYLVSEARVDMTTLTIENIADLARILREHPEWRETVRSLVLGEELSQLPQKLAAFIEATSENFRLVHERMDRFEAGLTGLRTDVNKLTGRVDNMAGQTYEIRVESVFPGLAKQRLGLSRARILRGGRSGLSREFADLLEDASDDGRLTSDEYADIQQIDFVSACRRDSDQTQVYFAAEISITASDSDIERALRRSELLSKVTGRDVVPGIVSASVDAERQDLAQQQGVSVLAIAEA